ncbi:calcium homeostasis modulator protein 3 [Alligator mississippiensis]|uniref:Calcium homeostasis modulator protein 3 n=1 Tax=Alligator mississippiensis TaxID=8496 RepID=A0A151NW21_ALLMI|nr:calcium homeostasis modulator protein 3 [Alligator mississippiensis]KYO40625.1 calcium homeostasis modulator protein 3 [Alligator mississippiensis]
MDRFRMIFQYFQSNSESVMNGICGLLALASVKIYTSFDFNCPCLPKYNTAYGMGIMFVPPIALFLCGLIVNRQSVVMLEEWKRPTGGRKKDLAIIRYMCSSIIQRAMVAPIVWIIVSLLDGKCFICAFSGSIDPEKFAGFANLTQMQTQLLLSKVPCKEDELMRNNTSRKAVSRYLRCWSQALGWSILLLLIVVAFLARWLRPCFNQAAFVQTRYWSNYIDMEQKIFEETCCEHARDFANKCILHFFESMRTEIKLRRFNMPRGEEEGEGEADHLRGITDQEQVNKLLKTWYSGKPPLDVSQTIPRQPSGKEGACTSVPWGDTVNNRWAAAQKANVSRQTDV